MSVNRHIAEGTKAHADGVKWYNNPYEAGSVAAYDWDKGHTIARQNANPIYAVTIEKIARVHFCRAGYRLVITKDGVPWKPHPLEEPQLVYVGDDGRKVRSQALQAAKAYCAKLNFLAR